MSRLPPIVAFAAPSGTGKTTLIEGVVRVLVGRGHRVGVLKADAHRLVLDRPGKDSWRFGEAGASPVAVMSAERLALFERLEGDRSIVSVVERLFGDVDLVLAEGFRRSGLPTVRVWRAGGPSVEGWEPPVNVVVWAADGPVETALPVLPLGDPEAVASWIWATFGCEAPPRVPTVICPAATRAEIEGALSAASRLGAALGAPWRVVAAEGGEGLVGVVRDLRPSLGLLGALFTGLAVSDTPEVLLVGQRHWAVELERVRRLLEEGRGADVVAARVDGRLDPSLAVYGHRCLSHIQSALLSGERKMDGWWGQTRVCGG